MILYNNTDLISKASEKITTENAENCRCRQPQCPTSSPLIVWVYLHSNFRGGLRKRIIFIQTA